MSYTDLSLIAVLTAGALDLVVIQTKLIVRKGFWTAYAIVISFQLLTNAWLTNDMRTGTAIVSYDSKVITGWRIAYAPVEDLLFGFSMVLLTLVMWIYLGRRSARSTSRKPSRDGHS